MAAPPSHLGQLLKDYLFLVDKKEMDLAYEIGLSPNKVSAAIHGRYRFKRDHVDRIASALTGWGVQLTEEDHAELLDRWQEEWPYEDLMARMADTELQYRAAWGDGCDQHMLELADSQFLEGLGDEELPEWSRERFA